MIAKQTCRVWLERRWVVFRADPSSMSAARAAVKGSFNNDAKLPRLLHRGR